MSFDATKWVIENSPYTGGPYTVHLVMAHIANGPHDWQIWMSQETLAEKARVSERTVRPALQQMIEDGYLEKVRPSDSLCPDYGRGGRRPTTYRLLLDLPETTSGIEPDLPETTSGIEPDDGETYRQSAQTFRQSASDFPAISAILSYYQRKRKKVRKKGKENLRMNPQVRVHPKVLMLPSPMLS